MRHLLTLVVSLLLIQPSAFAANYVCYDDTTKQVTKIRGSVDGVKSGYALPNDNTSIIANCINVTDIELSNARKGNQKVDMSIVTGSRIIDMTQAEIDTKEALAVARVEQAELGMIDIFDVENLELMVALIKRLNIRMSSNPITKQELIQQIKTDRGL